VNRILRTPSLALLLAGVRHPGQLDARRRRAEARDLAVRLGFDGDTVGPVLVRASLDRSGWLEVHPPNDFRVSRPQATAWAAWQLRPLLLRLLPHLDDPLTRMWLLWVSYLDARYRRLRDECDAARVGWVEARRMGNPKDPMLVRLARACGFHDAPPTGRNTHGSP